MQENTIISIILGEKININLAKEIYNVIDSQKLNITMQSIERDRYQYKLMTKPIKNMQEFLAN